MRRPPMDRNSVRHLYCTSGCGLIESADGFYCYFCEAGDSWQGAYDHVMSHDHMAAAGGWSAHLRLISGSQAWNETKYAPIVPAASQPAMAQPTVKTTAPRTVPSGGRSNYSLQASICPTKKASEQQIMQALLFEEPLIRTVTKRMKIKTR